jgi:hypothetical protein
MQTELNYILAVDRLRSEAAELFSAFAGSPEKITKLASVIKNLKAASPQKEMVLQSARAIEVGVYRGSIVLGWAAVIDAYQHKVFDDQTMVRDFFSTLNCPIIHLELYREKYAERNFLDIARKTGLTTKADYNELVGMLNERNACAHPSDRWPTLNEATGYLDKVVRHINSVN